MEQSSGKDARHENFPVGSWLLPRHLRPHVACFYRFARAADDIADSPALSAEEKITRLDGIKAALMGEPAAGQAFPQARSMAASLKQSGVSSRHCMDLLAAFRQDAVKTRYHSWSDLMDYCRLSAAPVGRYLIDLHGGSRIGYTPGDSLCAALQVINHVQDFGDDYRDLDRVYLPEDWMLEAGVSRADLAVKGATPALRSLLDRVLRGVDSLLMEAEALPGGLYSRRLGLEASVILRMAGALNKKLAAGDPSSRRVVLTKVDTVACFLKGLAGGRVNRW